MGTPVAYIESYQKDGTQILGTLDGQMPLYSPAEVMEQWDRIVYGPRLPYENVHIFKLVDAHGRIFKQWPNSSTPSFKKGALTNG